MVERQEQVAILTLNRPERMHTMGGALVEESIAALQRFHTDPDVRVVIITDAGGLAFCAGADMQNLQHRADEATPMERRV